MDFGERTDGVKSPKGQVDNTCFFTADRRGPCRVRMPTMTRGVSSPGRRQSEDIRWGAARSAVMTHVGKLKNLENLLTRVLFQLQLGCCFSCAS